jgi:hypothetical protein
MVMVMIMVDEGGGGGVSLDFNRRLTPKGKFTTPTPTPTHILSLCSQFNLQQEALEHWRSFLCESVHTPHHTTPHPRMPGHI